MAPLRILVVDRHADTRTNINKMTDAGVELRVGTPGWHLLPELENHPTDMVVFGHAAKEADQVGLRGLEEELRRSWPGVSLVVYWGDPLEVVTSAIQRHRAERDRLVA